MVLNIMWLCRYERFFFSFSFRHHWLDISFTVEHTQNRKNAYFDFATIVAVLHLPNINRHRIDFIYSIAYQPKMKCHQMCTS